VAVVANAVDVDDAIVGLERSVSVDGSDARVGVPD